MTICWALLKLSVDHKWMKPLWQLEYGWSQPQRRTSSLAENAEVHQDQLGGSIWKSPTRIDTENANSHTTAKIGINQEIKKESIVQENVRRSSRGKCVYLARGAQCDEVFSAALSPEIHSSAPPWHKANPDLEHKPGSVQRYNISEFQLFLCIFVVPFVFLLLFLYFFICFDGTVLPISLSPTSLNRDLHIWYECTFLSLADLLTAINHLYNYTSLGK